MLYCIILNEPSDPSGAGGLLVLHAHVDLLLCFVKQHLYSQSLRSFNSVVN